MGLHDFSKGVSLTFDNQSNKLGANEHVDSGVTSAMHQIEPANQRGQKATDFTAWSEQEIVAFLERRGEDYDDCLDVYALIARAQLCEQNTGPATKQAADTAQAEQSAEDDALEAFMAEIEQDEKSAAAKKKDSIATDGCDTEDVMDDYIEAHAARTAQGTFQQPPDEPEAADTGLEESEALEHSHRDIQPLEAVDHSKISYAPFKKDFYDESPDVFALDDREVADQRAQLQISVQGRDVPKPVLSFEQCGFPPKLMSAIASAGFSKPTAVQSQVLPVRSSHRKKATGIRRLAATGVTARRWRCQEGTWWESRRRAAERLQRSCCLWWCIWRPSRE